MLTMLQSGDTCQGIVDSKNITITQLRAWNPFVNSMCTNLRANEGVCVAQPGVVWSGTTIAGATVTKTAVYATATVPPPGAVAHGKLLSAVC